MAGTPPSSPTASAKACAAQAEADAKAKAARQRTPSVSAPLRPPSDDEDDAKEDDNAGGGPSDLHQALLLHEAAAIINLHAQAVAVQNILSLISVVLDVSSGNYTRWRDQFLRTVGKFSLQGHVLLEELVATYLDWACMDCIVKSWILGTISNDLVDTISSRGSTARAAWVAVESQFLSNRETRALYLDVQFRGFTQGYLSITNYCRCLKQMADDLGDLGETVIDRTIVLNHIRGLNEWYGNIGLHLRHRHPFPSFLEVKDALLLEELTLKHQSSTPAAFVVSHATAPVQATTGGGSAGSGSGGSGGTSSKASKNRRSKCGGKKDGTGGQAGQAGQASSGSKGGQPWPSFWNPWTGSIQMWPGSRPPLAPLPQPRPPQQHLQQQQQALLAYQQALLTSPPQQQPAVSSSAASTITAGQWAPPPGFYNPLSGLPSWDQQSLASAFSIGTLNQPQNNNWYFNTGSHEQEADHQFNATVKAIQCDNGKEFDNSSARIFFLTHGVHLRMSCPYTSARNGVRFPILLGRGTPYGDPPSEHLPHQDTQYVYATRSLVRLSPDV
ncbi:uncharacterized protein LOC120648211 [Panicum virgatum]|uniref:uncharacterized protein LOC120648211 n=1 Tax=Panicum virgatum TaxID=38727 RepID=UPI0019D4FB2F|nr:uncharacterized protein LOC120648211 [Panicum virgatum]